MYMKLMSIFELQKTDKVEIKLIVTDLRVCLGPRRANTIIVPQCLYNNKTIAIIQKPKFTDLIKYLSKKKGKN